MVERVSVNLLTLNLPRWQDIHPAENRRGADLMREAPKAATLSLNDAIKRARHYGAIARDALGMFPEHPVKQALLDIVDFTIEREF